MKNVYIELLPGFTHIPLLFPNLGREEKESILFLNNAFSRLNEPLVNIVEKPEDADYILVPHNYSSIRQKQQYLHRLADLANDLGKKLVIFWHGDGSEPIEISHAVVFRTSQYGFQKAENEVMMPAYAEDLCTTGDITPRSHHTGKSVIGFCGWAQYKNMKNRIGTTVKNALIDITRRPKALKKGLTYRMNALDALQNSDHIETNVLIRNSYSGHTATIRQDPQQARAEYVQNMLESDFALVVKGDGNYSYRFYEALSLGRIPVLIDTECILPLQDVIDYDAFVITVNLNNLDRIGEIVAERWNTMTPEEYVSMQYAAREAFSEYLRPESFLRYAVTHLLE